MSFFVRWPAAAAAVVLVHSAAAEDWPRWRGPRGDGTWNAPNLPETWPAGGPRKVWSRKIGAGYAGIVVTEGRLYTMDRLKKPAEVERVLCFDAADGKPLWSHEYPVAYGKLDYGNGPRAAPTVADGKVYTLGAVGHACCLEADTGKPVWSRDFAKEAGAAIPVWGLAASPVIEGDLVILHAGARPDGCVTALDRKTGQEVWRAAADEAGYCTPILVDAPAGRQLVVWTPANIRGLDPKTGKPLWSIPYKVTYGVSIATPIYHDGLLFVSGYWEGTKMIRLGPGATDAAVAWEENENLRGLMSQALYRGGHGYCLDKQRGLVCFDYKTGRKVWDDGHRMTPKGRNPHASLVWAGDGGRAIILNSEGELILARLSPDGYAEQSRAKILDGKVWGHPAFAGRFAYARSDGAERPTADCELVCVELVPETR